MDEKFLVSLGLSQNQAQTYRALVIKKSLRPSQLVKLIGENRTNCYALLDRLVELGLATKIDERKKFTYYPASPMMFKTILDEQLGQTEQKLQKLDRKLPQMLSEYHAGGEQPQVTYYKGKKELKDMFVQQMEQEGRELYFIRSKADVPYFGLEMMHELRMLAPKYKKRRIGITPIVYYSRATAQKDARSGGLKRAWLKGEEYTAPVEWAVSGNLLQAIYMDSEGYGISISHPEIAESFRQILQLLFHYIKLDPDYQKTVKSAKFVSAKQGQ